MHDLFAKWLNDLPGFVLAYLALFGLPRFGIRGFLSSLWTLAENVGGIRSEVAADFKSVKESQVEIKAGIARIEARQTESRPDDGAIRLSIK